MFFKFKMKCCSKLCSCIHEFVSAVKSSLVCAFSKLTAFFIIFSASSFVSVAYAGTDSFGRDGIMQQLGSGFYIIETVSVVMGLGLFVHAFTRLKRYGEMRGNQMGMQSSAAGPILCLLGAIMLLSLPQCISILQTSLWGTSTPETSISEAAYDLKPMLMFVRIIGVVTIIRGILSLTKYTPEGGGGGQSVIGRGLMQIIIGLCCAHIIGTARVINSVTGNMLDF